MVSKKKEINNNKKPKIEKVKVDEQEKSLIKEVIKKFKQYRRVLFLLILTYIICYLVWLGASELIKGYFKAHGWDGDIFWVTILAAVIQGLLFCLDGYVSSLIKSPFSQMNQKINQSNLMTSQERDELTFRNTNSNENCKETLKKFGILQITTELVMAFIRNSDKSGNKRSYEYERWMVISYLIPLAFVFYDVWRVHRKLKEIKKRVVSLENQPS